MQTDSRPYNWYWSVFVVVFSIVLAKNVSLGVFQQIEELLLLSPHERGQTEPVAIGWPLQVLSTEGYTLNLQWVDWADRPIPIRNRVMYALIDSFLSILVAVVATRYLCRVICSCSWRLNIRSLLALTAVYATLLNIERERFWFHDGVGAASSALFRCIDAFLLICVVSTWYWLLTRIGANISHVSRYLRRVTPAKLS